MNRFWHKIRKSPERDGCWLWQGATNHHGYGVFHVKKGVTSTAHKFSYKLAHPRTEIADGLQVQHKCDNRRCVNPDHLKLGTPRQNTRDMLRRGRQVKSSGKAHGNSRLSWSIVRNIRATYQGRYGEMSSLCKQFGVSKATIKDIISERSWKEKRGE